jgi:hypothetical protein
MRACLIALAALLAGAACAQGTPPDAGAMCRSFCDADAKECRKAAAEKIEDARHGELPMIMSQSSPSDSYDFTAEKREQAERSDHRERASLSQHCSDQRFSCRRLCAPASPAVSAPR